MGRRDIYIRGNARGSGKKIIIALILLVAGLFIGWFLLSGSDSKPKTETIAIPAETGLHTPVMPEQKDDSPTVMSAEITLGRGETLGRLMRRSGVKNVDMSALSSAINEYFDLKNLKIGQKVRVFYESKTLNFQSLIMPTTKIEYLEVKKTKTGYESKLKKKKVTMEELSFACMIRYSFHRSMRNCGANSKLTARVETFLARRIDLFRQVRRGDLIRLIIEKVSVSGRFLHYGHILALTYKGRVVNESAFFFDGQHYDKTGETYEQPFLPSPIRYSRVKWGKAAYKQSKKKKRLSLEYSVPSQTGVFAVGDGIVLAAGRDIRLGRLVILKHEKEYRTYYARLASIEKGVRVGNAVKQGQLIGRVSRHPLYFAVSRHSIYRSPSVLAKEHGAKIEHTRLDAFMKVEKRLAKTLNDLPVRNSYGP